MKKLLAMLIVMTLLLSVCSCSLASTKAQLLGLKNHLEKTVPGELIWGSIIEDSSDTFSDYLDFVSWDIDEEEGGYVGVIITSTLLDRCVLDYINHTEDEALSTQVFLLITCNLSGQIAKQAKAYGVTDTDIIVIYVTDKDTVGAELTYGITINADEDTMTVKKDDIFGATGPFSFSEHFDKDNYLDLFSFGN